VRSCTSYPFCATWNDGISYLVYGVEWMKWPKRFNTVFYKLMFTYSLLLLVTIVFVGITSYVIIARTLNEEVERNDKELLAYVETMSEHSVFTTVQKLYQKLVVPHYKTVDMMSFFGEANLEDRMQDVYDAHQYLKEVVENQYNVVDSVDFYFLKSNAIMSSELALHHVQNDLEDSWVNEVGRVTDQTRWFVTKALDPKGNQINAITYIGPYPEKSSSGPQGYIAIQINELSLSNILKQSVNQDTSQLFILTPNEIVSRSGRELPANLSFVEQIRSYPGTDGHIIVDIGGTNSIVSFHTLESTGWKIVRITSVEKFYAKNSYMRNMLILIGIIALLIGYAISNVLTARMYNPLKSIVDKAKRLFGDASNDASGLAADNNEYAQINALINNLSGKVESLETTLESNLPVIKSKLILDLFQGNMNSYQELEERFELLQMKLPADQYYTFVTLELDYELMRHISLKNRQLIIYSLIDEIDSHTATPLFRLASESPSQYRIEVLICANQPDDEAVARLFQELAAKLAADFYVTMVALIGTWERDPLQLEHGYKQSGALLKYTYFHPSQSVLFMEALMRREASTAEMDELLLEEFARALKGKRPDAIKEGLLAFMNALKSGSFSTNYSHKMLRELVYIYYRFVKDMNLSTRDILSKQLFTEFENIRNIEEFERWSMNVIETTFSFMELTTNTSKSAEIVKTVKAYVASHLPEDLSLDVAASVVFLSPRYLSKIFKQEAGENFVDFVTKERMNAAAAKILSTEETIEAIALGVGYNNPAYFTKRFKETFGVTPTAYRERK